MSLRIQMCLNTENGSTVTVQRCGSSTCWWGLVRSLDYAWLGVLDGFLSGLCFCRDQTGPSSRPSLRPDLTVVYNNCVVSKARAVATALDIGEAELSLTSTFHGKAHEAFPLSPTVVGVCSSATLVKIFRVSYNHVLQTYESTLMPHGAYNVDQLSERVRFLVDVLKLLRWVSSVSRPLKRFHLVPGVRTATRNHHCITWNGAALIKEFQRTVDLQNIARVYGARLDNVAHGEVLSASPPSVRSDRIGKPLAQAMSEGFNKSTAFQHVVAGLEQLRSVHLGHGDIDFDNVFVDDNGVAFGMVWSIALRLEQRCPRKEDHQQRLQQVLETLKSSMLGDWAN